MAALAAMEGRRFTFAKVSAWGLLVSTGVLCVAGALSLFATLLPGLTPWLKGACIVGFSGIALFSLLVAQAATSCAQILDGKDFEGARIAAFIVAGLTGLVSIAGVYLADAILHNRTVELPPLWAMLAAAFALAYVKQAMFFVISACETKTGAETRAHDDLLDCRQREIDALRRELSDARREIEKLSADSAMRPARPAPARSSRRRPARASDSASRRVAMELAGQQPDGASGHTAKAPAADVQPGSAPVSLEDIRSACREIMGAGGKPSLRLVAENLNVKKWRVEDALKIGQTKLELVARAA